MAEKANYAIKLNADGAPIPRHNVMLPGTESLRENYSDHLANRIRDTGGPRGKVGLQYIPITELAYQYFGMGHTDALHEVEKSPIDGLVYNYQGKVEDGIVSYGTTLIYATRYCNSHCGAICTRGRAVGKTKNDPGSNDFLMRQSQMNDIQMNTAFDFIRNTPLLNEGIVTGGDPFNVTPKYFEKLIGGLAQLQRETKFNPHTGKDEPALSIVRIGTRLPFHDPDAIQDWHYEIISRLKNPQIMVHVSCLEEFTNKTQRVIDRFNEIPGAAVHSQSVALKGVNFLQKPGYQMEDRILEKEEWTTPFGKKIEIVVDKTIDEDATVQALIYFFVELKQRGINPYVLYQNDPQFWTWYFTIPDGQALRIHFRVIEHLRGLFQYDFVFDNGAKVRAPKGSYFDIDLSSGYLDADMQQHPLSS